MAALHEALQSLGPANFDDDVPSAPDELDGYVGKVFADAQLVLDSIPIANPDESQIGRSRSHTVAASTAAEMRSSAARSEPPPPDRIALQKEWGKPIKLGQKENTLGMSVYKTAGKDGKGAWFARKSVHEGLGFDRFMKAFEKEFPTSLAVQGAPGEGNVRGIGAETKVVDVSTPGHAKMQVYRLSAQFPGPTTPRDFVTLLLTSSKALKPPRDGELIPRHYMIVSKPCDHPETQPRNGFIRGQYESVEFIREIPRKLTASTSTTDLSHLGHKHGHNLEQDVLIHNAEKRATLHPGHDNNSSSVSREASPIGRKRSHTVDIPEMHNPQRASFEDYDPDQNPVEWIMVTRSDPGGSVPRFMVERGTPSSICADAVKFLDWACQLDDSALDSPETPVKPQTAFRRESFTSFAKEKNLLKVDEEDDHGSEVPRTTLTEATPSTPNAPQSQSGIFASVAGAVSAYAPHALQEYLPHGQAATPTDQADKTDKPADDDDDDASSTISSLSFASADSHLSGDDLPTSPTASMTSSLSNNNKQPRTAHEKELAKLSARRAALESKHAATVSKLSEQKSHMSAKEEAALKRAEEKHSRELKKHEERYQREVQKLRHRKEREEKKVEEKRKRQVDKDEKERLRRERDELKEKLDVVERERDLFMRQVGELQKENTLLVARNGRLEAFQNSSSDLASKDSDSTKSGGKLSRTVTPTPTGSTTLDSIEPQASRQQHLRPALGAHQRTVSENSLQNKLGMAAGVGHAMDQFGNRFKAMTFHTLGIAEQEGETPQGNRNRSSSLFRKKEREGATTPTPEKSKASGT